ncbi:prepilin-type N-terminal cleavage/methylation domain-containing protein [Thalassotalea sp. 1_MG-2023]|uniref:type IV pilus modification PilV family protein n=1 Tax=Thalassotalea sp. 1_MG-2023 TaxID=3062680 RepID=UPI0026E2541F|nr:prepilin-type N-terminal cleavage/methylation domain-containing protein [Thalassotalea sp. 1_MG-2023]MDO6426497.1 prepilin-type N-terminal cleavage/methylation domain-containing protein [Thalassotalea sp. 1_MG-2023]
MRVNIKQQGFTLIEVLVASFILFLVIASITLVYRGALLSSGKAERTLLFTAAVEPITESIRANIQATKQTDMVDGQGTWGTVIYSWVATPAYVAAPPERINMASGELEKSINQFVLWNVELELKIDNALRVYHFNEVSW